MFQLYLLWQFVMKTIFTLHTSDPEPSKHSSICPTQEMPTPTKLEYIDVKIISKKLYKKSNKMQFYTNLNQFIYKQCTCISHLRRIRHRHFIFWVCWHFMWMCNLFSKPLSLLLSLSILCTCKIHEWISFAIFLESTISYKQQTQLYGCK